MSLTKTANLPLGLGYKMYLGGVCSYGPCALSSQMFRCMVSKQSIYREQPAPLHRLSFHLSGCLHDYFYLCAYSNCLWWAPNRNNEYETVNVKETLGPEFPRISSKVGVFQYLIYDPCSLWVPGFSFWKAFRIFPQNISPLHL